MARDQKKGHRAYVCKFMLNDGVSKGAEHSAEREACKTSKVVSNEAASSNLVVSKCE